MAAKETSAKALGHLKKRGPSQTTSLCLSCHYRLLTHSQTRQASTATAASEASIPTPPVSSAEEKSTPSGPTSSPQPKPVYSLHAGLLLSRPPFLTRSLTPFEKSFYLYQRRLNERLALPFTRYFYIKKGTPADVEWKRKIKQRKTAARDIGIYNAYDRQLGWNDEVLVGDRVSEPEWQVEMLLRDAESAEGGVGFDDHSALPDPSLAVPEEQQQQQTDSTGEGASATNRGMGDSPQLGEGRERIEETKARAEKEFVKAQSKRDEVERPRPRMSEADRTNDHTSLDRMGWRTLYLLVRGEGTGGRWEFPSKRLLGKETLRQGTERILHQSGGPSKLNYWLIANHPIGHYTHHHQNPSSTLHLSSRQHNETKNTPPSNPNPNPNPSPTQTQAPSIIELGEKTFFMKARIMAGQVSLEDMNTGNENGYGKYKNMGVEEFKWLSKEEVKGFVSAKYWKRVGDMLVER